MHDKLDVATSVNEAFTLAATPRRGPVFLDFPLETIYDQAETEIPAPHRLDQVVDLGSQLRRLPQVPPHCHEVHTTSKPAADPRIRAYGHRQRGLPEPARTITARRYADRTALAVEQRLCHLGCLRRTVHQPFRRCQAS